MAKIVKIYSRGMNCDIYGNAYQSAVVFIQNREKVIKYVFNVWPGTNLDYQILRTVLYNLRENGIVNVDPYKDANKYKIVHIYEHVHNFSRVDNSHRWRIQEKFDELKEISASTVF